ncbi:unnamed protein product, partial [Vitis vinifera]
MSLNLCERQNPSTISVLIIIKRHRLIYTANDVVFCLRAKPHQKEIIGDGITGNQFHSITLPRSPGHSPSSLLLLSLPQKPFSIQVEIMRSLVILLFWILAVLIVLRENFDHILIHESLVFVFAAISFVAEYSVIGKGINGLGEAVYEWLGGLTLLCAASCLYLSIRPTAFFAEFLLCSGIVFKGTWLLQAGLSLYSDVFSLKGCHKFLTDVVCDLEEDSLRGVALMNLLFIGHAIGVLITSLVCFMNLRLSELVSWYQRKWYHVGIVCLLLLYSIANQVHGKSAQSRFKAPILGHLLKFCGHQVGCCSSHRKEVYKIFTQEHNLCSSLCIIGHVYTDVCVCAKNKVDLFLVVQLNILVIRDISYYVPWPPDTTALLNY